MNFVIKAYDPIEEAIALFDEFNRTPAEQREHSEDQLTQLVVHRIKQRQLA